MKRSKINIFLIVLGLLLVGGVYLYLTKFAPQAELTEDSEGIFSVEPEDVKNYIERIDTMGLIVLYPNYSSVDLVCGEMPSKTDSSVVFVAAAAYTGECLKEFKHSNIAGDHVSGGEKYKGYKCKRNNGLFLFYNNSAKFCKSSETQELDSAAKYGGAAFSQEFILHNGELLKTYRKNNNKNCFRALCNHNDRLCIIESDTILPFGDFKNLLKEYGVTDAIYLDMGTGWNHAWYREKGDIIELHPKTHSYFTNWITFYK